MDFLTCVISIYVRVKNHFDKIDKTTRQLHHRVGLLVYAPWYWYNTLLVGVWNSWWSQGVDLGLSWVCHCHVLPCPVHELQGCL